jgi:D-glycero-D-manno-heptose 1,7-bisphosphate phosphatase
MLKSERLTVFSKRPRALFLDRDGVININHGYVHSIDSFDFVDGIFDLARNACAKNYKIVVITNQSGIGRGFFSEEQFHQLTLWMCEEFLKVGAPIERVFFSPFHPIEGVGKYKKDDFSRKPNPGMILQAQEELGLDLKNSILVGDKSTDIEAGIAAGIGLNFFLSQECSLEMAPLQCYKVCSLLEVVPFFDKRFEP